MRSARRTLASSFTSGAAETTWFEYRSRHRCCTDGDNTIAVELHQARPNNADGIFDLELVAHGTHRDGGAERAGASPPAPPTFSSVPLSWTASTDNVGVIGYVVRRDGTPIAFTPSTSFVDTGLAPGTAVRLRRHRASTPRATSSAPGHRRHDDRRRTRAREVRRRLVVPHRRRRPRHARGASPATTSRRGPTGPSQLGWGDRGETTVVPSGQITQYFVRHFNVDDPSRWPAARTRGSKRDDGAAVYLNGIEIAREQPAERHAHRDDLPEHARPRPPTPPRGGSSPHRRRLLVAGDNVIAVELHQDSRTDTRLGVRPRRWRARRRPSRTRRPGRAVTLAQRDRLVARRCSGPRRPTTPASPATSSGATARSSATPPRRSFTDTGLSPQTPYGYEVIAIDTSGNASTPGLLAASTTGSVALTSTGDVWTYRSNGVDPGTAWRQPGFDASTWASGPSQLGWGGRGETTGRPERPDHAVLRPPLRGARPVDGRRAGAAREA